MNDLKGSTLSFIGTGVMAEAMIKAILDKGLIEAERIVGSGPRAERAQELESTYGIVGTTDNRQAARAGEIVVLSVKPQVLPSVLEEIAGEIPRQSLVLSIVAGAPIRMIGGALSHDFIVRTMPNTPAQVSQGMTVWTATPEVTEEQRAQTRSILRAMGEEIYVQDEGYLNMATALSGTGPAYVFLFMEALVDAGVHLGFSRRVSQELVLQTVQGSVTFARQSTLHPAELRNMVTSPGGTCAEALYQLEKGGLRTVLSRAVWAAYQKSKYLGGLGEK